jgi:hypothetical protein
MIKQMTMREVEKQINHHNSNEHIMWKLKLEKEVFLDYLPQVNYDHQPYFLD